MVTGVALATLFDLLASFVAFPQHSVEVLQTDLSLEQVLYLETNVAVHCAANPDFKEGVRALLIDKDRNPQWSRSLAECLSSEGQEYIHQHFVNPYAKGEHPLGDWLGDEALGSQLVR